MSDSPDTNTKVPLSFDGFSELDKSTFDIGVDATFSSLHGTNATIAGIQTKSLNEVMNNYAQALNEFAIAKSTGIPVKTSSVTYKGFAAEEYFKHTLKINALAKGIPDWKIGAYTNGLLPDGTILSPTDPEVDITVFTREYPWSPAKRTVDYQSKIHSKAKDYIRDQDNIKYKDVKFVGGSGQGVNDTVKVDVSGKTISSDTITSDNAEKLADVMKAQNTPEYQHKAVKNAELNQVKFSHAIAFGAATGAILSTVKEIAYVIKERKDLPEDQWIKSIQHILCGTAEGGIRGGAIAGSTQLLGKALGKVITEDSFGAVPVMAITNTAVDFAKDLYRVFVTHTIDTDDLLCNTVNNAFSSLAGFGGAWTGAQVAGMHMSVETAVATGASIGSAAGPLGTVIGSVIGGLVIGVCATLITGTANKDAQKTFNKCIADINEKVQQGGCDTLYYYADTMSEISGFRLSFKNLLPCYNLISDLREYNLRKKAIKHIHEQLDDHMKGIEATKRDALQNLEKQHAHRLKELEACFRAQRKEMEDEFKDSMDVYIANAYAQYLTTLTVFQADTILLREQLVQDYRQHNKILTGMKNRNAANEQLNEMLDDLMNDPEANHLVKPFVIRLHRDMQKAELTTERQYLSFEEALSMQGVS